MKQENVIQVEELTKKFGDFHAVNAISFEVKKGEIFGFSRSQWCRENNRNENADWHQSSHFGQS